MIKKFSNLKKTRSNVESRISYLLLFFLLAFSGNPVFIEKKMFLIIFGMFLFVFLFISGLKLNNDFKAKLLIYLMFFLGLFCLQFVVLEFVSFKGVINFCFKILVGSIIVHLLGYSFREKYLNLMFFLGVISIIGFVVNLFGIKIPEIVEVRNNSSIIVFGTYNASIETESIRNSGMFWEPGAYAGYILLIPLFYMGDLNELWKFHKMKCVVLIVAINI
jgi:hypothetical protein